MIVNLSAVVDAAFNATLSNNKNSIYRTIMNLSPAFRFRLAAVSASVFQHFLTSGLATRGRLLQLNRR